MLTLRPLHVRLGISTKREMRIKSSFGQFSIFRVHGIIILTVIVFLLELVFDGVMYFVFSIRLFYVTDLVVYHSDLVWLYSFSQEQFYLIFD